MHAIVRATEGWWISPAVVSINAIQHRTVGSRAGGRPGLTS